MDTVSNTFSAIKNAAMVRKGTVSVPYSKLNAEILKLLSSRGMIKEPAKKGRKHKRYLEFTIQYDENGNPFVHDIKRISKPSRRVYLGYKDIKKVKNGLGFAIVSTPKGIIDDSSARKLKVGGEVLGTAW